MSVALVQYDAACRALAEARSIDVAKDIRDKAEALRVYARQAQNRELEVDAAEIRMRAERRIGEMLREQRDAGALNRGGRPSGETGSDADPVSDDAPPTLADVGIDKHLADRARKLARIPDAEFEAELAKGRERALDAQRRVPINLLETPFVSHYSGEIEWYTPPEYIEAARDVLGQIDLDPASSERANAIVRATRFYDMEMDGLAQPWHGRVWMNPPYAKGLIERFTARLSDAIESGEITEAIALVNNPTETRWFQNLLRRASALCLPLGRIHFMDPEGNIPGPPLQGQAILYLGEKTEAFLARFAEFGWTTAINGREVGA